MFFARPVDRLTPSPSYLSFFPTGQGVPMSRAPKLAVAALLLILPACYHATIETGLAPSTTVVEQPWAMSFIGGLIPPSTVQTQSRCPSGVSKVETKHSFLNMLAGGLTGGIISPMSIKVTCASGGRSAVPATPEIRVGDGATPEEIINAFRRAADVSVETHGPVYVKF